MSYSDYEDDTEDEIEEDNQEEKHNETMKDLVVYCKYGNKKKVVEVLEEQGDEFASKLDVEGHTLVHWAALGGFHDLVDFLVEKGAPLNDQSNNDYGPLPIHWACVHGHILTVEYFLNNGVHIDSTDRNGCTPLIVSAQYGESLCVSYLLQKGANKFHVDTNGDSALHWASFKGNPEIVLILLNAGLNAKEKDSFGQTPLHSSCIKGDIQCVGMLIKHGADPTDVDVNGKTPRMLAEKRRHRMLVKFLDNKETGGDFLDWRTYVFGPPSRNRYALLFYLCAFLVWAYPFYFLRIVPLTLEDHHMVHLFFWIFSVFQWVLFYWTRWSNPGFVKPSRQSYDSAMKMIGNPTAWGDFRDMNNPIFNICHTCKTVRPIRSKHCRHCNKCVEEFDHHCQWLDHCIGRKNRVPFTFFLLVMGVNSMFAIFFMWEVVRQSGADIFVYFGMLLFCVFFVSGVIQTVLLFQMIITNMTTNEKANSGRYRHFKNLDGKFHNPFDHGMMQNCMEYWHLSLPSYLSRARQHSHVV